MTTTEAKRAAATILWQLLDLQRLEREVLRAASAGYRPDRRSRRRALVGGDICATLATYQSPITSCGRADRRYLAAATRRAHSGSWWADTLILRALGGKGSGNFGHAGRPGEIGGSGETGSADDKTLGSIMHQKVGAQAGSNPGGFYRAEDGGKWYVKQYHDPNQGYGEHAANALYHELGIGAPHSLVGQHDGKTLYASKILPDVKGTVQDVGLSKETANKILDGFAADAFTGNWDAVGLGFDNVVVHGNGSVSRIDNGGTFLHRAMGSLKGEQHLNAVGEWKTLADRHTAPYYSQVFKTAGLNSADDLGHRAVQQIDRIAAVEKSHGSWAKFVEHTIPHAPSAYKQKLSSTLTKRMESLHGIRQRLAAKLVTAGGPGSGNFGHAGRPGEVGGSSEGGGSETAQTAPKKEKAPPSKAATKEQIANLVNLKKNGYTIDQIVAQTGIGKAQAANIIAKHQNAEKAIHEVVANQIDLSKFGPSTMHQNPDTKMWEVHDKNGLVVEKSTKGMAQAYMDLVNQKSFAGKTMDVSQTINSAKFGAGAKEEKGEIGKIEHHAAPPEKTYSTQTEAAKAQGYQWIEKTKANSPYAGPENLGKYAWFKDGKQVSAPFAKGDSEKAVETLNQGTGLPPTAKATGTPANWPISNSVDRKEGTNTPATMDKIGSQWKGTLTYAESNAVQNYTGSGYDHINTQLRENPNKLGDHATLITKALDKSPKPPPPDLVWRGTGYGQHTAIASKLQVGDDVTLNGFQSTSISPNTAKSWGSQTSIFEIKPTKGAYVKVVSLHKHEKEYLLPHGAKFRVVGISHVTLDGDLKKVIQLQMH